EAFGCIKLEGGIDAQHIDGADLRDHVGGNQHHDLVKALLRADRLRHDFAKPAQQHARTTKRATHGVRSLGPGYDRSAARDAPVFVKEEFARSRSESECPKAYIECGMQTASQRQRYDGSGYCAPQRKRCRSGRFIESVQRMQGPYCKFGEGGVNQKRKLYL